MIQESPSKFFPAASEISGHVPRRTTTFGMASIGTPLVGVQYKGESESKMKRSSTHLIFPLILIIIALLVFFIWYRTYLMPTNTSGAFYKTHILGGFSIDTPAKVSRAAHDGVQVVFKYGQPPTESDQLGQKLQSLRMKVIDGYISSLLYYYECHRTKILRPSLVGQGQYCQDDSHPYLSDQKVLLATIVTHLKEMKDNQLVIGYWVLDDWVQWDAGSARQILIRIHQLIQQYTPGRPAICGFGGSVGLHQGYGWNDWVADNFSPQGCDKVGFYIYTSSLPDTTPTTSPDDYNWSMSGVLPAMFTSFKKRGWEITKEPLIGVGQVFGGHLAHVDRYWVAPTAKDIETQSRSFCEQGATGISFYAWDDSGFGPTTQTPMNSPEMETGIRNGITACKVYWSKHPQNELRSNTLAAWSSLYGYVGRKRRSRCLCMHFLCRNGDRFTCQLKKDDPYGHRHML